MIRKIILAVLRFALRVYFRRIEIIGLEHVPLKSPVIFVLNHPNALVDPVFLFCLAPRRVSFLAKAPLFRMPVLGFFIRALDSLPVYRRKDEGEDVSRNEETFVAARKLLAGGGTIGICPEGVSHSERRLLPIKTGAARIALGAVATGEVADLKIVPAGLYYTSKTQFRSGVLLYFGKPIDVPPVSLEGKGNLPRAAVRELSDRIECALREVILDAEQEEALQTIARAEKIFSAEADDQARESLAQELQLQQRFIKAYTVLRQQAPERLRRLELRMSRFEQELIQAGVDPDDFSPPPSPAAVLLHILIRIGVFAILILPATVGVVVHYPAYRLGRYLATRFSRDEEDVVSTVKIISGMLFLPLTWVLLAALVYKFLNFQAALATLLLMPLLGYLAVRFFEEFDKSIGGLRALAFFLMRRRFFVRLLAERKAIHREILALGEETAIASQ
ncbi:MAG TPA: lysophospholipid acyltransferase family protein [Pyrinomonadaceae bacterium]|nr:lysophospholipid acyltransferase family protein [Pyrinomonadaceae bacterium]